MYISRNDVVAVIVAEGENEAVKIAAENLKKDLKNTLNVTAESDPSDDKKGTNGISIYIESGHSDIPTEGFRIEVCGEKMSILSKDRRGAVYGIYSISEQLGVSPWHFFADVPSKKKDYVSFSEGVILEDYPGVPYRGIFINDEEELEAWVKKYMGENTIGEKTYEKIFELLLRLKMNYIWPAMHVNSFNMVPENGRLADRMGIIVGTSHCDILMRSNNREWLPWLKKKGYEAEYDISLKGKNREILLEYWRESIQQNKDFDVSYTIGMRGIHDSGFETRTLEGLEGKELMDAKTALLEETVSLQENLLKEVLGEAKAEETLKIFIPYKEVLELYDNGMEVPEDLTLVWVNDNYGYVRRYPSEKERTRKGGNGIYYHNSYWAPPGNSYMFICTTPLAHTRNELLKAYENGIQKLWVCNFGCIKPIEEQMSFFADLAFATGKDKKDKALGSLDEWVKDWLLKNFTVTEEDAILMARLLNDFDQVVNVRKIEHLDSDIFPLYEYGDEGAHRIHILEQIMKGGRKILNTLPSEEKPAFFQMVCMKLEAAYYSNCMFYYGDRSRLCMKRGSAASAEAYTYLSLEYDKIRRKMLYYYNKVMLSGKWDGILTPDSFPPPRTALYPECRVPLEDPQERLIVNTWGYGDDRSIVFSGLNTKWIEVANAKDADIPVIITAPFDYFIYGEGIDRIHSDDDMAVYKAVVRQEKRFFVENLKNERHKGKLFVCSVKTGEAICIDLISEPKENGEDDGRIVIEADKYRTVDGSVSFIDRLGRDRGALCQLNSPGSAATYVFNTEDNTDVHIVIHRFPNLNSIGRIRCIMEVDGRQEILETFSTDEKKGMWKENVQNNVDTTVYADFELGKGSHILKITALDPYFSYSRIIVFTQNPSNMNLGVPTYGETLPNVYDLHKLAKEYYGNIKYQAPNEVFANREPGDNANTDYNFYSEGDTPVLRNNSITESRKNVKYILNSGKKLPTERKGSVTIYAASALADTEYATIENGKELVSYCQSSSFGMTGIALLIPEKGLSFSFEEAPRLTYSFAISQTGVYTVWLKMFMWGYNQSKFEISIDGKRYTQRDFCIKKLWTYGSENMWVNYPCVETELSKGGHTITIHLESSRLRLDKIVIGMGQKFPGKEYHGKTDI